MTYGPIDFFALEFPSNQLTGEILHSLIELVDQGTIRIVDLVVVQKDQDGQVVVKELQELQPKVLSIFDPLKIHVTSMITRGDIDMIADQLPNNTTSGIMLIENLWAIKTKEAMMAANGRLLMFERIPNEVVVEALADIAVLASAST